MLNVDNKFTKNMNYDVQKTDQSFSTSVASINTRNICFSPDHHDVYPVLDFPEEFRIDAKPFVNRPFFLENVTWSNQSIYSLLPLSRTIMPRDVFTSNSSLEHALKMGAYYRSDLSLSISVAGTITHAGTLLVGILPPLPPEQFNLTNNIYLVNTILSGPHCFLHANEATSAVLHVPWYCNTDVASLDSSIIPPAWTTAYAESNMPSNYGTLVMMVLSPLSPSTGSSTSLNITVEASFNALDIFVPSPRFLTYSQGRQYLSQGLQAIASAAIDATTSYTKEAIGDAIDKVRAGVKYYTGLHNPNVPLINNRMIMSKRNYPNNTTGEQFFEKLDPYPEIDRIVDRPIFNTAVDEMSIAHILSKPQYIGRFRINALDGIGKLLWCNAISPRQGGLSNSEWQFANNIELIHYLSRAWRGSIKIHVQAVMNNKQQVKLRLIQLYNPPGQVYVSHPLYASVLSAPSHLLEFTAGGQLQTIELPYLCRNALTPCSPDLAVDGLFHGMYYIYLAQALANSSDSPQDIHFNVFISGGDDLTFHGYSTEIANQAGFTAPVSRGISETTKKVLEKLAEEREDQILSEEEQDLETVQEEETEADGYVSQGLEVMNEPQLNTELERSVDKININAKCQERLFSPVDVRPFIRRMYPATTLSLAAGPNVIKLNEFIGERFTGESTTPLQLITGMYYGKSPGLKIKIRTSNETALTVQFAPPQVFIRNPLGRISASVVQATNEFSPLASNTAGYSLPFLEMAQDDQNNKLFEFVVPNANIYKFIGGPEKYTQTDAWRAHTDADLSISDFGSIVIWSSENTIANLYIGMTDESRLGFHCIAPITRPTETPVGRNNTIYKGSAGLVDIEPPLVSQPPFMKYART